MAVSKTKTTPSRQNPQFSMAYVSNTRSTSTSWYGPLPFPSLLRVLFAQLLRRAGSLKAGSLIGGPARSLLLLQLRDRRFRRNPYLQAVCTVKDAHKERVLHVFSGERRRAPARPQTLPPDLGTSVSLRTEYDGWIGIFSDRTQEQLPTYRVPGITLIASSIYTCVTIALFRKKKSSKTRQL